MHTNPESAAPSSLLFLMQERWTANRVFMFYEEQFGEIALNGYLDNQNLKPWKK